MCNIMYMRRPFSLLIAFAIYEIMFYLDISGLKRLNRTFFTKQDLDRTKFHQESLLNENKLDLH